MRASEVDLFALDVREIPRSEAGPCCHVENPHAPEECGKPGTIRLVLRCGSQGCDAEEAASVCDAHIDWARNAFRQGWGMKCITCGSQIAPKLQGLPRPLEQYGENGLRIARLMEYSPSRQPV